MIMTEIMAIRIVLTLQSMYPIPNRTTILARGHGLGKHRSRTSTFLTSLPPSEVAYSTAYTLGIMIRVAEKPIDILFTVLLGDTPCTSLPTELA